MSDNAKVFLCEENGLTYTVTVYQADDGSFKAQIEVLEGHMDVNAVYFGDDDFSGESASLGGPLNMNGGGSLYQGESVQWDDAIRLSDPGLGPLGTDKETYLAEGDMLEVDLDIDSLDEIDFFGVRATSTSTPEGSIKCVAGDPEEPPEEPEFDLTKVFFVDEFFPDSDIPSMGMPIRVGGDPEHITSLPEDIEPTFQNIVEYFASIEWVTPETVQAIQIYDVDAEGNPQLLFGFDVPEFDPDTFVEDWVAAYEAALAEYEESVGDSVDDGLDGLFMVDGIPGVPVDETGEEEIEEEYDLV